MGNQVFFGHQRNFFISDQVIRIRTNNSTFNFFPRSEGVDQHRVCYMYLVGVHLNNDFIKMFFIRFTFADELSMKSGSRSTYRYVQYLPCMCRE